MRGDTVTNDPMRPKRPTKSEDGALEELLIAVPVEAERLTRLEAGPMADELAQARARAWGRLKERDYERWNGALMIAIWRSEGRIPGWTQPVFVGETPEAL